MLLGFKLFGWHLLSSYFRLRISYYRIERVVKTPTVIRTFQKLRILPLFCALLSWSVSFVGYTAVSTCWRADGEAVSEIGWSNWGDVVRAALFCRRIRDVTKIVFTGSLTRIACAIFKTLEKRYSAFWFTSLVFHPFSRFLLRVNSLMWLCIFSSVLSQSTHLSSANIASGVAVSSFK